MEEKKSKLNENGITIIILIGVISIYHHLMFKVGIFRVDSGSIGPVNPWLMMLIPGLFVSILFYGFFRKGVKALMAGLVTTVAWFLWFIIYAATTYRVH